MSEKRSFILGLGHQKCGTSWLHKYLCQSDVFAEGHVKEYHVWDRVDIPLFESERARLNLVTLLNSNRRRAYRMENSDSFYFEYFDKLMGKDKFLAADMTPSYSGLRAKRLELIRKNFSARDIDVKVVILVRDPLSRVKSAVRFNLDRKNYSEGIWFSETNFEKALTQYYKTQHCSIRTNYQNIIREASKAFDADNIYIGFYESMFEENEIRRISGFFGIDVNLEFAKVQVNKTKSSVNKTKMDSLVKDYYSGTYEFFYENFPIAKRLWP